MLGQRLLNQEEEQASFPSLLSQALVTRSTNMGPPTLSYPQCDHFHQGALTHLYMFSVFLLLTKPFRITHLLPYGISICYNSYYLCHMSSLGPTLESVAYT